MTMTEFQHVDISAAGDSETRPPCMLADDRTKVKAGVKREEKEKRKLKRREKRRERRKRKDKAADGEEVESGEKVKMEKKRKRKVKNDSSRSRTSESDDASSDSNYESMEGILSKLTGTKRKRTRVDESVADFVVESSYGEVEADEAEHAVDELSVAKEKKKKPSSKKSKKKSKEREREKEKKAMRKHRHAQKKREKEKLKQHQHTESDHPRHSFEETTSLTNIKHILDDQYGDEDILAVDQVNQEVMQVLHDYEDDTFARMVNERTAGVGRRASLTNNNNSNSFAVPQPSASQIGLSEDLQFMDMGGPSMLDGVPSNNMTKLGSPLDASSNNKGGVVPANKAPSNLPVSERVGVGAVGGSVAKAVFERPDSRRGEDLTFDDIDDADVDCYVRSTRDNEAMRKIWHVVNRDFLMQKAQKEREAAIAAAHESAKPKRARRSKSGSGLDANGEEKKSNRLNYDALKILEGLEAHTRANDFDEPDEHAGGVEAMEEGKATTNGAKKRESAREKQAQRDELRMLRNEDLVDYVNAYDEDYYDEDEDDAEVISFI
jgi:hypothetical protein